MIQSEREVRIPMSYALPDDKRAYKRLRLLFRIGSCRFHGSFGCIRRRWRRRRRREQISKPGEFRDQRCETPFFLPRRGRCLELSDA
jgi:hypothetical protein